MTQITATLGDDANPSIIQQVLENMKGVLKVSIHRDKNFSENEKNVSDEWLNELHNLADRINLSTIDIDDERTRYILRGSELLNESRVGSIIRYIL